MFIEGRSYKSKLNGKIYRCRKSTDGYLRLYYEHKGQTYSLVCEPGWNSGLHINDFEEI